MRTCTRNRAQRNIKEPTALPATQLRKNWNLTKILLAGILYSAVSFSCTHRAYTYSYSHSRNIECYFFRRQHAFFNPSLCSISCPAFFLSQSLALSIHSPTFLHLWIKFTKSLQLIATAFDCEFNALAELFVQHIANIE